MRYYLEPTSHSPLILFEKGVLLIAGRSIPEDSVGLYEPLFTFIERYAQEFPSIEVQVKLEYANSSTNRSLMTIFELMLEHVNKGNEVHVSWYHVTDDVEMQKLGTDFKEIIPLNFTLVPVESLQS